MSKSKLLSKEFYYLDKLFDPIVDEIELKVTFDGNVKCYLNGKSLGLQIHQEHFH